jgi:septal ring factor EnvC (AmiA/AmiB activator)
MNRVSSGLLLQTLRRLLLLILIVFVTNASGSGLESEVAKKNKQLADRKKAVQALTQQERTLHKDLAKLENSIKSSAEALTRLEQELEQLKKKQDEGAKRLEGLLAEREKTVSRLAELMRTLWPIYLTARDQNLSSPEEWAAADRGEEWIAALYREAQTLYEDIERQGRIVAEEQAALEQNTAAASAKLEKIKTSRADLDKKKSRFQKEIKEVRTKKAHAEKELQNLAASISKLKHQISLQATKKISKHQGKLTWPAQGKTVVSFAPNKNPASNGIGLALPAGTQVRSMSWGKVVHNDQLRGFGQVVIIFHGEDYYSLYAFLSATNVSVGQEVERGQQIGTCGFYPAAGGNGLYFELRFRQKAVNPLQWLPAG